MKVKCNLKVLLLTEMNNMRQKELAAELGMNYNHFNRIVNGKVVPTLPVALRIAKHIGKHVDEIWEFEQKNKAPNKGAYFFVKNTSVSGHSVASVS